MTDRPFWKPPPATRQELRKFGFLLAAVAVGLGLWRALGKGFDASSLPAVAVSLAAGVALVLLCVARPRILFPIWWPWMVLVNVLGFVNSHLLLALVFYLLFTPTGLLMRLLGKDPLGDRDFDAARRTAAEGGSLWHRRARPRLEDEHFERQF